jgi:hypothetical protein
VALKYTSAAEVEPDGVASDILTQAQQDASEATKKQTTKNQFVEALATAADRGHLVASHGITIAATTTKNEKFVEQSASTDYSKKSADDSPDLPFRGVNYFAAMRKDSPD